MSVVRVSGARVHNPRLKLPYKALILSSCRCLASLTSYNTNTELYYIMIEKIEGFEIYNNKKSKRIVNIDIGEEILNKLIFPFNKFDITALDIAIFSTPILII